MDNEKILSVISDFTNISKAEITGPRRKKHIRKARNLYCYFAYQINNIQQRGKKTKSRIVDIARLVNRKHPAMISANNSTLNDLVTDNSFRLYVCQLRCALMLEECGS